MPTLDELIAPPGMHALAAQVRVALANESPVLVTGATGTGKTALATALATAMRSGPVVRAMLGASDDLNTIASELFGHERGAFSGAVSTRRGLVSHAEGGVLVLDEVLNLPRKAQQILLDLVQFGTYRPLGHGGAQPCRANVRIVAVTNGDLAAAAASGAFREDLYYRLRANELQVPLLRDRRGDVPGLADALLQRLAHGQPFTLALSARRALVAPTREWPGNVRELAHLLEQAVSRARTERKGPRWEIRAGDVGPVRPARGADAIAVSASQPRAPETPPADDAHVGLEERFRTIQVRREALEAEERDVLEQVLARHGQVVAHAAKALGIARTTLASRLARPVPRR